MIFLMEHLYGLFCLFFYVTVVVCCNLFMKFLFNLRLRKSPDQDGAQEM